MAAKNTRSTSRRTKKAASVQSQVAPSPVGIFEGSTTGKLEEQIRLRAYELFLERGSAPGNESEDWLVAEREVLSRAAAAGHNA